MNPVTGVHYDISGGARPNPPRLSFPGFLCLILHRKFYIERYKHDYAKNVTKIGIFVLDSHHLVDIQMVPFFLRRGSPGHTSSLQHISSLACL